ncbi:D-psicose/D-tagatose/L-ribulose 3-epimerase [Palleronia aestuarii]|uniref:D-psicose/D-tagatose/L-ribulose 3-epimerase n=1 Tax=Palleronia aestuarii TaxID=568105 RepID=A0A2W7NKR0_9RHOB|nr:sugar phosphate isomerase/epimerase family protein [Palleronia aestuarii]PZX13776.1 D-psicose/D-tagatose/L-ribulose 3-epimerase [Palleronia aestuarii]
MNKLGLHANVWVAGWSEAEADRAISMTAKTGFELLEIPAFETELLRPEATRRAIEAAGISCTLSLGLPPEADIASRDPDRVKAGEAQLMRTIESAGAVGATHISGILYGAFTKHSEPPLPDGIRESAEIVARAAEEAAKHGVTLCMEVVNRYETNILNTAAQARAYCDMVGRENVGVHLDVYHMHIEENDPLTAITDTAEQLVYFHTGDSHRGYMGSGSVDLAGTFRALVRAGYEGPITYESFSSEVVGQPLTGILGIWRNTWEDGEDLARHAHAYTTSQLKAAREAMRRESALPGAAGR